MVVCAMYSLETVNVQIRRQQGRGVNNPLIVIFMVARMGAFVPKQEFVHAFNPFMVHCAIC